MKFTDRQDAAERLFPLLEKYRGEDVVVLAVPRGGVPVGYFISRFFRFPMDLLMTKKIGYPGNEELAVGAVSPEGRVLDPRFHLSPAYIEEETRRIQLSLNERYQKFTGGRNPVNVTGKTVIIVDDGIATGNTILAAIEMLKHKQPAKIVVAVPVAPQDTVRRLQHEVDDVVSALIPRDFYGVGQFYEEFSQVSDEEVILLMKDLNTSNL